MSAPPAAAPPRAGPQRVADLAYALGRPRVRGQLRLRPEDFRVEEQLGFSPSGSGPHAWLFVEKRDANTHWIAGRLAAIAGVAPRDVGYAGMKDRRALTRQWFSVPLGARPMPDWRPLGDEAQVLTATRSQRKLRRGAHRANRFTLRVRVLDGDAGDLQARLRAVAAAGVPNYFGAQRFGHGHGNLQAAERLLVAGQRERNRHRRGLLLSAARSWLFNQYLHRRVLDGSWGVAMPGEWLLRDEQPSGPLWGTGANRVAGPAALLEQAVIDAFPGWARGLEAAGLRLERRALVCRVQDLSWSLRDDWLVLRFALARGQFATAVLRELLDTEEDVAAGVAAVA